MLSTYSYPKYDFVRPPELDGAVQPPRPVVVVGAGPVGLAAAIELAQAGTPVVLLDDDNTVSVGSRGVCYARRALEVLDRIGVGDACVGKGVSWNVGRTFLREQEVYHFNLSPEPGFERPGMINLQQYYLEEFLVERARQVPGLELRFQSQVVAVLPQPQGVQVQVRTPQGDYTLEAQWLIAADGARSPVRHMLGLDMQGRVFQDRFLIADVVMQAEFPHERWFWFDPPFHPGQSVLLHRQADHVYRIDFQLGWQADPEEEKKPERVIPRIRAMLGPDRPFELEWVSVYTFQCRRMERFRHGRVLFVGDAAHQVSPFGARGANSGLQDTDNLIWKLRLVLQGLAPESLLETYSDERVAAADENLLNSTRSTDFITPKSRTSMLFRNAVLDLAREHPFARTLVNSGRLSVPSFLSESTLNTPDAEPDANGAPASWAGVMVPGAPAEDAPLLHAGQPGWLLRQLGGGFVLLAVAQNGHSPDDAEQAALSALAADRIGVRGLWVRAAAPAAQTAGSAPQADPANPAEAADTLTDNLGLIARRYDLQPGSAYLLRPDQHVAARWRRWSVSGVRAAVARATGHAPLC